MRKSFMNNMATLCLSLTLFLFSCGRGGDHKGCIDLDARTETSIFDVFEYVDAVQLETREEVFLSAILGVQQADDKLFVLDYHGVFCFSLDGDFLFQLARQGRGPGEFHYVSDIAIDNEGNRLVLLDNVVQRVHFFSFAGEHLETIHIESETSLGLNQIIPLPDSLLLFRGNDRHCFILYCLKEMAVLEIFGVSEKSVLRPSAFITNGQLYTYNQEAFVLPLLQDTVYRASRAGFEPYYSYCFGKYDNTSAQISSLVRNYETWHYSRSHIPLNYFVGRGRYLHNYISNVLETSRFVLAKLEFDGGFLNLILDKQTGEQHVFNVFKEGVQIPGAYYAQDNGLFLPSNFYPPTRERTVEDFAHAQEYANYWVSHANRNRTPITRDMLTDRGKQVYDNHDPMYDNPYLVIFRFKE